MKQFFRFLTVGVFNTLLGYCIIFACMYLAKMSPEASNITGYAVGLVTSYLLNRTYTFRSQQKHRSELIRFLIVFAVAYGLNFAMLVILIHKMSVHEGLSQVLAGVVYVATSFILNKYYVFKISHGTETTDKTISNKFTKNLLWLVPALNDYQHTKPLSAYCIDRNNNFNLLRLIGASLVIFGHSYATFGPQGTRDFINVHIPIINASELGVQIFFVISGFLVAQSFVNRPHIIEFSIARVLRIFPGLLVALLLTVLLGAFMTTLPFAEYVSNPIVWDYFLNNGMLQVRWELPGVFENNSFPKIVNGSLWTLPKEFSLYIILLVVGTAGGLSSRAIINLVCALVVFMHLQQTGTYYLTNGITHVDDAIFCFMLGVLFYANREHILISFRLTAVLLLLTTLSVKYDYYTFVTVQVCIAYLVFIIAYHEKLQLPIFRHADYSYGLYIYAFPLQQTLAELNITKHFSLYILLCFAVILPFAIFSWHVIEKPSLRLKDSVRKLFPLPTIIN